jgi:hypothetical protein
MSQQFRYPSSSAVTASIPAVGVDGAAIPLSSILLGAENPSHNLMQLQCDASGILKVTSALLPTSLGQKVMAQSLSVAIASDQSTLVTSNATVTARLSGSLVPAAFDEIDLTYVPSGNGAGQVATAVYKLASATVKTLTLSYDGSDRLSSVVAS